MTCNDALNPIPKIDYWWSPTEFKMTPVVRKFLDESKVDPVSKLSTRDQIAQLIAYVRSKVQYRAECVQTPPRNFDEVISTGRGACLQLNLLSAAVIVHAGFKVRVVMREPAIDFGHLWLEVDSDLNLLIVDATREDSVHAFADIAEGRTTDAFARDWYLHVDRKYHPAQ